MVTKRYTRWVAARNVFLATIILFILDLVLYWHWNSLFYLGLAVLFFIDVRIRKEWLNEYVNPLIGILETHRE